MSIESVVDLDARTAGIFNEGFRQERPMDKPRNANVLAQEIAGQVCARDPDERLRWSETHTRMRRR